MFEKIYLFKNKFFRWIIRILIYPFLIYSTISIVFFYLYSKPPRNITPLTPANYGFDYKKVEIKTSDGINLKGWFIPYQNSDKAIILLHGWPSDKGDILTHTLFLSSKYSLLYIDFRAMGESEGRYTTGGYKEKYDIEGAVKYLKEKGFKDIALYGYSMGGYAAIMYLIEKNDVKVVIADSPYDNIYSALENAFFKKYGFVLYPALWLISIEFRILYGKSLSELSISNNINKINKSTFIICGTNDKICYNKKLNLYNKINEKIEVLLLDDFSHNETIYYKKYETLIMNFLEKNFSNI